MPVYRYKARDMSGAKLSGSIQSASEAQAARSLIQGGVYPYKISRPEISFSFPMFRSGGNVKAEELISFTTRLATLVKAGAPLDSALAELAKSRDPGFSGAVDAVRKGILDGKSLCEAMALRRDVFSEVYTAMVEAGEYSGTLDRSLEKLRSMLERQREFERTARQAARYPKIVLSAMGAAVVVLMVFVIPRYVAVFEKSNIPLPLPTRVLIWMDHAVWSYFPLIFAGVCLGAAGLSYWIRTPDGRLSFDRMILNIPLAGEIVSLILFARWADTLGNLIGAGAPLIRSISLSARVAGNAYLAVAIENVGRVVSEGSGIATPVEAIPEAPSISGLMIRTGEKAGSLDTSLVNLGESLGKEAEWKIKRISAYVEPVLTVMVALLVLLLALAVFLPMWDMAKLAKRG
ncbi:MAG: type II secretion system F family protein [Nitrospinae bacterium]|nr:type II secretion system F family protein [Nitrospinota bacterium]